MYAKSKTYFIGFLTKSMSFTFKLCMNVENKKPIKKIRSSWRLFQTFALTVVGRRSNAACVDEESVDSEDPAASVTEVTAVTRPLFSQPFYGKYLLFYLFHVIHYTI